MRDPMTDHAPRAVAAGLCASCKWVRLVTSVRQTTFYMCQLSATDPAYPKYPRLPVLDCAGYVRVDPEPAGSTTD
jgi:hypothetical protein